ncbi:MAG: ABC transporter permease [Betaproteobacteria bacterium]
MADIAIATQQSEERLCAKLSGDWTLSNLPLPVSDLEKQLCEFTATHSAWDLYSISRLDSAGANLLWRAWGERWPDVVDAPPQHLNVLKRAEAVPRQETSEALCPSFAWLIALGQVMLAAGKNLREIVTLIGQLVLDLRYLFSNPQDIPWREFSATVFKSGAQALPVTALIGFLIGIVLSYLSAIQLKTFGADIYIVNLLGVSIIRELGPVIVAVLVAGRSGSAMTAQIGVMRVTEEIDALVTMGVSKTLRLVLPKVLALSITMPLLVVWCSAAGLVGGMVSANLEMGLAYNYFIEALPRVVPLANLWIGMGKGFVFGLLIALLACHFGLKVRPNTESLSAKTTMAVVTAITVVILVDALFAILTRGIGMPGGG